MSGVAEIGVLTASLFFRHFVAALTLLSHALMSRSTGALELPSAITHNDAEDSGEHTALVQTTRLAPFELEAVLHAGETAARTNGANDNDDAESTLTVSPEESFRLLTRAFRNSDDEITLEAPAPSVPDDVPSPLGAPATPSEHAAPELPPIVPEPGSALGGDDAHRGYESVPDLPLLSAEALVSKVSGIRPCVTPDRARAMRDARDVARLIREEEAKTRLIVLGIWGAAVMLAGLLAFFALVP